MSVSEAAKRIGMDRATLYNWVRAGEAHTVSDGRSKTKRVTAEEVERLKSVRAQREAARVVKRESRDPGEARWGRSRLRRVPLSEEAEPAHLLEALNQLIRSSPEQRVDDLRVLADIEIAIDRVWTETDAALDRIDEIDTDLLDPRALTEEVERMQATLTDWRRLLHGEWANPKVPHRGQSSTYRIPLLTDTRYASSKKGRALQAVLPLRALDAAERRRLYEAAGVKLEGAKVEHGRTGGA